MRDQYLNTLDDVGKEILSDQIQDKAEDIAIELGVMEATHYSPEELWTEEEKKPQEFFRKATGKLHVFDDFLDDFLGTIERVRSMCDHRRAMEVLMKHFQAVEQIDWEKADSFLNTIGSIENVKNPTVKKWKGTYIKFWNWLGLNPAVWRDHVNIPKSKKGKKIPWQRNEVRELYETLRKRNDVTSGWLADVVWIAAHTGAREGAIAELEYNPVEQTIYFPALKNEDEERTIPAHPAIRTHLTSWMKNKRSKGSICNRFSELKTELGYNNEKDFHSFRRTFNTEMENLEVPEAVTADIVGHKKKTISYGLYSGGTKLPLMRKHLFKLDYEKEVRQ